MREVHSLATSRIGTVYVRVAGRAPISTVHAVSAGEVGIYVRVIVFRASAALGIARNPQSRLEEAGGEKRIGEDG